MTVRGHQRLSEDIEAVERASDQQGVWYISAVVKAVAAADKVGFVVAAQLADTSTAVGLDLGGYSATGADKVFAKAAALAPAKR